MRKLILISAFVLASASVQAGESRGLTLAANDQPETAATAQPPAPAIAQPEAAKAEVNTAQPEASKLEASKPEASKKQVSRPKKIHARHYEGDEAKARRIAARYGVYW